MNKPRLLDLFCGAGGCSMGYHRAGFEVVGVDHVFQKRYPFEFHQADALTFPLGGFDVIHASPPCQAYTGLRARHRLREYPDLIPATRQRLQEAGVPWVIENVPRSPLINPIQLCGSSFGLRVRKHRLFESNLPLKGKPCNHDWQNADKCFVVRSHGKYRKTGVCYVFGNGGGKRGDWNAAMGIDWMTRKELSQAIPPAYTEWIGKQILEQLRW